MVEGILGLVGTVVAALIGGFVALRTRGPRFEKPELVDVSFTSGSRHDGHVADAVPVGVRDAPDGTVTLDVKLRNPGAQPVFVVRAVLDILEAHTIPYPVPPEYRQVITCTVPVSRTYDVHLPLPHRSGRELATVDLSQMIPPTDVDRFRIRLGRDPRESQRMRREAGMSFDIVYRLVLRLVYGSDGQEMVSRPLLVGVPQAPFVRSAESVRQHLLDFIDGARRFHRLSYLQRVNQAGPRLGSRYPLWEPRKEVARYLDLEEARSRKLLDILQREGVRHPALEDTEEAATALLDAVPRLRQEFLDRLPR